MNQDKQIFTIKKLCDNFKSELTKEKSIYVQQTSYDLSELNELVTLMNNRNVLNMQHWSSIITNLKGMTCSSSNIHKGYLYAEHSAVSTSESENAFTLAYIADNMENTPLIIAKVHIDDKHLQILKEPESIQEVYDYIEGETTLNKFAVGENYSIISFHTHGFYARKDAENSLHILVVYRIIINDECIGYHAFELRTLSEL